MTEAGGVLLSPDMLEILLYAVIFLFGGEKALQMRRRRSDDSMTDGNVFAVRLKAVEEAIKNIAADDLKVAVAELREAVDSMKEQLREIWSELRKAG